MAFGRAFRIAAIGLGAVTLVMGVVFGFSFAHVRTFLAASTVAPGEVVGLVVRQSCEEDEQRRVETCHDVYAPRVRFTTQDGREIVFESGTASSPASYATGDRVDVRYRVDRPADARVDSFADVWLGPLVTGLITAAFAGGFAVFVVLAVRFRRE